MVSELWITKLRKRCHFDVEEESQILSPPSAEEATSTRLVGAAVLTQAGIPCVVWGYTVSLPSYSTLSTFWFLIVNSKKLAKLLPPSPQSAQSQILVMIISATHSWLLRKRLRDLLISQANWHSWIHYPHTRFLFALKCSLPVTSYFIWSERSEFFFDLRMQLKQYLGYLNFYCFS